jgi:hypothetical protein
MRTRNGIGGHQSATMRTDEWLTPPAIIQALGEFDLDPCSPISRPWDTAKKHYSILDNGLIKEWEGRVWLNPPYGSEAARWLNKMQFHGNGVSLIFARTETEMFFTHVWNKADSILFIEGRLFFHDVNGKRASANAGAPSCLVAYGENNVEALEKSGIRGKHLLINAIPVIIVTASPKWKNVIEIALVRLKGEASLDKIYDMVSIIAPDKIKTNNFFKEKIRQQLRKHFVRLSEGIYSNN